MVFRAMENCSVTISASVVLSIVGSVLIPAEAHAYIDPGSGGMMVQLLIAGFAGVCVGFRMFFGRIATRVGGLLRK